MSASVGRPLPRPSNIVACGAPLASRIEDGVRAARERGWQPYVIPTDAALPWLEGQDLAEVSVVSGNRGPGEPKRTPKADAVAVVPTTFNTLNAWANGSANTYPLTILCAALGSRTPIAAVPFAKDDLAGHPAWLASLAVLRYAGVRVIDPHDGSAASLKPVVYGTGDRVADNFRWDWVLRELEPLTQYPGDQEVLKFTFPKC
ncbi:flavoprotein [Kribbella jiaozuonensis]|uniref:Flavoprotein n=1 Tax=Kribbella jiaozuonensis TaxID=2575441 RepID=A0A4U3LC05_9ACTN|nr:flavoprotein [Kribbella jiaozuonensis]TKK72851.1 flavoprotein [Kribbella jiaozuonensis]TKK74081.1 flavoprotein [Kribbella jiaozuonensis]